jgi:DNA-binding transcriptional ArsR family regulator
MDIYEAIAESKEMTENVISSMNQATSEDLGLDPRSSYQKLYVSEDCIAVECREDRTLQYYGGFEYVDKEYRVEMGDYVFYLAEDERVGGHISDYFENVHGHIS